MTVKKLKELIKELPDDMEVIIQTDATDSWGSPLDKGYLGIYQADTRYYGPVFVESDKHYEIQLFDTAKEWKEFLKTAPRSLVLKPME